MFARFVCISFSSLLAALTLATLGYAENWPNWRGPRMDGVSNETSVPAKWSSTENVLWRFPLPGPAGATPVVWDDRIYLTSVDPNGTLVVKCVSTSGKQLWEQVVDKGNLIARGDEGNSASPSPTTDGEHVWVLMGTGALACYTKDGTEVWKFNVQERYGKLKLQFGFTSTPVLDRGRLYVQMIHGDRKPATQEAMLVCLDAATSDEIWKHSRVTGAAEENEHSYASPTLYRDTEREYLVAHGGDYVTAHSLSDGRELWRYCLNPKGALYHPTLRFVASPLATHGMVIAPSAKGGPVVCVRADAVGDISEELAALRWRRDSGTPDVPSPLYHDGLVYLCRENGNLICVDAQTGETLYEERTEPNRHRASPVLADGKVYLTARNGVVTVVRAGPKFEIIAKNSMGEDISSSPVVSNGRIYIRTFAALYAIGPK